MGAQASIRYRLDLALRLLDSVSGRAITENTVQFFSQSPGKNPIPKGGGLYLFLNMEREDFDLEVRVYGYEPRMVRITYPQEEEQLPIREIYLVPLDNPVREDILTLRGHLPGIEEIEAVSLMDASCCIKEFDAKKKIMTVLNQRNMDFRHVHYGLIDQKRTSYEPFEIAEEISKQSFRCKEKLQREFQINQPIVRIIFGQTTKQGDYVLKVAREEYAHYLVRFIVDGNEFFQKVDFRKEGNDLKCKETA